MFWLQKTILTIKGWKCYDSMNILKHYGLWNKNVHHLFFKKQELIAQRSAQIWLFEWGWLLQGCSALSFPPTPLLGRNKGQSGLPNSKRAKLKNSQICCFLRRQTLFLFWKYIKLKELFTFNKHCRLAGIKYLLHSVFALHYFVMDIHKGNR